MKTFEISVKDKIAVLTNREMYVCGNSDFVVDFSFDAEWDAFDTKTARFAYKGTYQDQVFKGTRCPVPIIHDTQIIMVGVFAGNLHTTTPACIGAKRSILSGSGVPADPAPDVYAQIMELIQGLGETDPETIAAAVADYIRQNPIEESDPTVPAWAKAQEKPTYTAAEVGALPDTYTPPNQTAQQVGADPAGTAASAVSQHNTDTTAHNDLRLALQELANRINAALDSDDTTLDQMSEVVAYIKSNKTLIDAITTSKVSVADIVNDLVTNAADKPLSAAQGVVIKTLIDALRNDKLDAAELTNAVNTALAQAKESGEFDGKPGDPGYTPVKGTDYFTEADKQEIAEQAAGLVSIPDKLPNPNALTFTGAVTGSYDGSAPLSVNIPQGGGGGSEKELTLLADINFDGNTASVFEYTGLDDVSEIYIVGGEIKSELDTQEAQFSLAINDIAIATSSVLTILKKSGTDTWNRYHILRFNGAFWESLRSPNHAGASKIDHANYAKYPNSVVLYVGKAKKLKLHVPNPSYKPVTGWMKIWVR